MAFTLLGLNVVDISVLVLVAVNLFLLYGRSSAKKKFHEEQRRHQVTEKTLYEEQIRHQSAKEEFQRKHYITEKELHEEQRRHQITEKELKKAKEELLQAENKIKTLVDNLHQEQQMNQATTKKLKNLEDFTKMSLPEAVDLMEKLGKTMKAKSSSLLCAICLTNENNIIFDPCGHSVCAECNATGQFRHCHTCRKSITKAIKCFR